jgi:hypothetical protein
MDSEPQEHFQQLVFVYLYFMPERMITPPDHWGWIPCRQANLSPEVLDIILNGHDQLAAERP